MAGYSGTPLVQKLGIKSETTVVLIGAPANYRKLLGKIPGNVRFSDKACDGMEFGHFFTKSRRDLETTLKELRGKIADSGTLWVHGRRNHPAWQPISPKTLFARWLCRAGSLT